MARLEDTYISDGQKQLKDSGERREFSTGAVRDTGSGKGRFDLLMPHAILRVAQTLEKGAIKYADRNWERGIPLSRFLDSGLRHLFQYLGGARDEDHLAQAAWNVLALIETQYRIEQGQLPKTLDGLPLPFEHKGTEAKVVDVPYHIGLGPDQGLAEVMFPSDDFEEIEILAEAPGLEVSKTCLSGRCKTTDDPSITVPNSGTINVPADLKRPWWEWCELCGIKHVDGAQPLTFIDSKIK